MPRRGRMAERSRCPADMKRGPMTAGEKAEIERLALSLRHPTASAIARRLNRHISTVTWYLLTRNLIERRPGRSPARPYTRRDGVTLYPWSPAEDARLIELRVEGKSYPAIGRILAAEFGTRRDAHKVHVRNVILHARPEAGDG